MFSTLNKITILIPFFTYYFFLLKIAFKDHHWSVIYPSFLFFVSALSQSATNTLPLFLSPLTLKI